MSKRQSKDAARALKVLGISADDPKYGPRRVVVGYRSIPVTHSAENSLTASLKGATQLRFHQMPLFVTVNPYRRLLKAMQAGTYSERLRLEVEELCKDVPSEPQVI